MPSLSRSLLVGFSVLLTFVSASGIDPFPVPFSSSFVEPVPPVLVTEFKANFMQQKYDSTGINNIIAGFVFFSPSQNKIRADGSFGSLFSSLFDFGNVSAHGEVSNRQLLFTGGVKASQSSCFSEFVVPGEMLFPPNLLNTTQGVFIGVQEDSLYGPLNAWQFLLPNVTDSVLVTVYLDGNNTLVRQDFSAPGQPNRAFVTTRFFNIVQGPIDDPAIFETDCQ